MGNTLIVGAQWGDEGKGKIIDTLAGDYSVVVRYQGGNNAGHTVEIGDQRYVLHLLPSGVLRKNTINIIGNNVVIDPGELIKEIEGLRERGIKVDPENLRISEGAQLILPYHILLDKITGKGVGTTYRGIGPAYTDKTARVGIRMIDLFDESALEEKVKERTHFMNWVMSYPKWHNKKRVSANEIYEGLLEARKVLLPFVERDMVGLIRKFDGHILAEGAQGTLLDVDEGTYPFVTSSNTTIGGALVGIGLRVEFDRVIGVMKAYTTRVGGGPFPTELKDSIGDRIRERGREFGSTTGRTRKVGWLDVPALRYANDVNGFTELDMVKLDVLSGEKTLKICVGYSKDGKRLDYFPVRELDHVEPIYEEILGWGKDIRGIQLIDSLPEEAIDYVDRLEELIQVPILSVGTGPDREHILLRGPLI